MYGIICIKRGDCVTFDKRQTNIAKGVAILLMLWHHLFYDNPDNYDMYTSFLWIGDKPLVAYLANFAKVCVAIFCILSGYGMFKSFESYIKKNEIDGKLSVKKQFIFVKNHLLKTMSGYWFIYIVFGIIMGLFCGRPFYEIYEYNILYGIIDFCGLASLFGTPTLNATWWFVYVIILYYILFPIIYKLVNNYPEVALFGSIFIIFSPWIPRLENFQVYLASFVFGMYFAKRDTFSNLYEKNQRLISRIVISICLVGTLAYVRGLIFQDYRIDFLFALSIIIASFLIISNVPILNMVLAELGKYSAPIFMFHTFIYSYYFKEFIYWVNYPVVIFIVLVFICYVVAKVLEIMMEISRYNKFIKIIVK